MTLNRFLCWLGLHKWLRYGPFDMRRHCVRCLKRQTLMSNHPSGWGGIDYWL